MIIKVCGMREPDNIRAVESLNPSWMGFILWPGSKRYVAAPPIHLPAPPVKRVGVFVNASHEEILKQGLAFRLDIIQLHGNESPTYCRQLAAFLSDIGLPSLPFIKAFNISCTFDLAAAAAYYGVVDYFLFDTRSPLPGGSGHQFDWRILRAYNGPVSFLLSGGIGPDDLPRVLGYHHPRCIGIDLNSRFEISPAHKDPSLLDPFIKQIKLTYNENVR